MIRTTHLDVTRAQAMRAFSTARALRDRCSYDDENKRRFLVAAFAVCAWLAKRLEGGGSVSVCEGGVAVSGEAILHGDRVYVQIGDSTCGILARSCAGRRDYHGGPNQWAQWAKGLEGLEKLVDQLERKP
jgi:hypothetical protein